MTTETQRPPIPSSGGALKLTLLGGVSASWQGGRLAVSAPRMLGLLAYLHLRGPTPRSELIEVFWPGQGAQAVRQALYTLRGLPGAAHWLVDGPEVQLHAESDVARVRALLHERADAEALALLNGSGPLFGHLTIAGAPAFEEWQTEQRNELSTAHQAALRRHARALQDAQEYPAARACLERLLQLDPLEEKTYRDLMYLEHAAGQSAQVLEVFETLRRTLHAELGAEPEPETLALLHQLEGHEISGQTRARLLRGAAALSPDALYGREAELEKVFALLHERGRALVQGMAGMGKTRLAWAAAERTLQAAGESGSVLWLELGGDPPEVLLPALIEPLDLRSVPPRQHLGKLHAALREQGVKLVVLDNAANSYAASVLLEYLPPDLPVLLTSRLRLPRLPTLGLHRLARADALALLGAYLPTQTDPDALDALCAVLGDHPYALRLAALNLQKSGQPPRELLQILSDAPHVLGEERSVKTLLQQSLKVVDAESYEAYLGLGSLLTPQATPELLALALRRTPEETERALYALLEHGLTTREAREGSDQITFRMHELTWHDAKAHAALQPRSVVNAVRQYAAQRTKNPELLYTEVPNLLAAAQYAAQHHPDELVQIMSGWLGEKYIVGRGFPGGYLSLLRRAVEVAERGQNWAAGSLLGAKLGDVYQVLLDDYPQAIEAYLRAATCAGQAGLLTDHAVRLCLAGALQGSLGWPQAQATLDQAYALAQASGDLLCECRVTTQQGVYQAKQGDFAGAYRTLMSAREILLPLLNSNTYHIKEVQSRLHNVLGNLGLAAKRLGRVEEATSFLRESIEVAQSGHELLWAARDRVDLAEIYLELGQDSLAQHELHQALAAAHELGASGLEATILRMLAQLPETAQHSNSFKENA